MTRRMTRYVLLAAGLCTTLTLCEAQTLRADDAAQDAAKDQAAKDPVANDRVAEDQQQQPADQDARQPDPAAAEPPQKPAAEPKAQPSLRRVPKHIARPNPKVQPTPRSILTDQQKFVPEAIQRPTNTRPQAAQADRQPKRRQSSPPYWSPWRGGLSPSAAYRLESLGNHVHLSPTTRWHLSRSGRSASRPATDQRAAASQAPGQGAQQFYPGVSRLPAQKPFADLERPPSGLQSYWPLLLEGREDPNTGLIIWSLP